MLVPEDMISPFMAIKECSQRRMNLETQNVKCVIPYENESKTIYSPCY